MVKLVTSVNQKTRGNTREKSQPHVLPSTPPHSLSPDSLSEGTIRTWGVRTGHILLFLLLHRGCPCLLLLLLKGESPAVMWE